MAEIAVIGAGPAGLSCTLFLAKAGRKVVVVDSGQTMVRRANLKNYLGFPGGLAGYELLARGREQIEGFGGTFVTGRPVTARTGDRGFLVTAGETTVRASQLVLATGMSVHVAQELGLPLVRGVYATRILATDSRGHTEMAGVWACGVIAGAAVQAIIAAGDGARVAVNMIEELRGSMFHDHDVLPSEKRRNAAVAPADV